MDEQARRRLEYEEQIFDFPSQLFTDSFKNFVSNELESSIDVLANNIKKKLIKESSNQDHFSKKIQEMRTKLKQEYSKSTDSEIENISQQICRYMNIPQHVLLKEDLPIRTGLDIDAAQIDEEINLLKEKFKAVGFLKQKIMEEIDISNTIIMFLENVIKEDINFNVHDTNEIADLAKSNLSLVQ